MLQQQQQEAHGACRQGIGPQQAGIAHSAHQHGHQFGLGGQPRREKNGGQENDEGAEQGAVVGHKMHVVVGDHLGKGHAPGNEVVQFLGHVKHHGNRHDQPKKQRIGQPVLPNEVAVQPGESCAAV